MRKIVVYCDRCGKPIEKVYHLTATQERLPEGGAQMAPGMNALHDIDLCWDCLNVVVQYAVGNAPPADTTAPSNAQTTDLSADTTAPSTADPVMVEVDKSDAVDEPHEDAQDTADADGAEGEPSDKWQVMAVSRGYEKGKLADLDPDYPRQLASEGLIPARIRDRIEQDYGIKVSISAVSYRLRKMGL